MRAMPNQVGFLHKAALVLSRIPVEVFARYTFPAYGAILVALVLVELIGGVRGGSQRWINLGLCRWSIGQRDFHNKGVMIRCIGAV